MANFLQQHYNFYRAEGCKHEIYVVVNDLSDETAQELRQKYESTPTPVLPLVGEEEIKKFYAQYNEEADKADVRKFMGWLDNNAL